MNVFILGRTEVLYEAALRIARSHEIRGILTAPAAPEYARTEDDFRALAEALGCPFRVSRRLGAEERRMIAEADADVCVSMNWVSIVGEDVVDRFRHGVLNAHFGDLPRYRGNAVTNWALLRGEPEIVFTIHAMEPGELDSGPIYLQRHMPVSTSTTIGDVVQYAERYVPDMFAEVVTAIAQGTAQPRSQDESDALPFRCYPRLPNYSKIDWSRSAAEIDALVRASTHPYSGAYTFLRIEGRIRKVYIWRSRVIASDTSDVAIPGHVLHNDPDSGESTVYTGKGVLALSSVQYHDEPEEFAPGRRWRSIRMNFGLDVEDELLRLQTATESKSTMR